MSTGQFNVGDVVRLKSGSPKMTVSQVQSNGVVCTWFSGTDNKVAHFPVATVEIFQEPRHVPSVSHSHTQWS
jgi:uncharacterized protein YodC (DUF2158 family)